MAVSNTIAVNNFMNYVHEIIHHRRKDWLKKILKLHIVSHENAGARARVHFDAFNFQVFD